MFFWSNEHGEPIHVHISKGKPTPHATKIWLTKAGGCIIANNGSNISLNKRNELLDIIAAQYFMICVEWKKHFMVDEVK